MAGRSLQITYLADAKSVLAAQQQIDRGHSALQGTTQKAGGIFQMTFGSVMPIAAAAAGAAVIKFGTDSVRAFNESQQVMAQTAAVLRSTGGAAGVTADDIVALAQRLRDLSGADDEAIQASSNLLLTFRDVRNEAGRGNDIFDQTQRAVLDMATAMNQGAIPTMEGLKSTTIQVGKAMNDPIRGLTALRRAGVTFTQSQVDTITRLQESGDLMGAQKVILQELTAEFGGAAKAAGDTFAGAQAKAAQKVEDLQEILGEAIISGVQPLLEAFVELGEEVAPIVELGFNVIGVAAREAAEEVVAIVGPITDLVALLPDLSSEAEASSGFIQQMGDVASTAFEKIVTTGIPGTQTWFAYRDAVEDATVASGDQEGVLDQLAGAMRDAAQDIMGDLVPALDDATTSHKEAEEAAREQRLAVLGLTNSFLGIADSASDVAEAQRELNRLEQRGKEDTKAYEEAVLAALEAQIGLEESVVSYATELVDSGEKQRVVIGKVKDLAREFGIQKDVVREIIGEIREYINALNDVPSNVTTTLTTRHVSTGGTTGGVFAQHGFHGVVRRPTVFIAGEAGSERVDITPSGRGGGASVTVNIGTVVGPGGIDEVAEQIRSALIRTGVRNGTAGIP